MVGVDLKWVLGSLYIHPLVLETLHHGKYLFVVDRVIQLRGREFTGVVANWV